MPEQGADDAELLTQWVGTTRWRTFHDDGGSLEASGECAPDMARNGHLSSLSAHALVAEAGARAHLAQRARGDTLYITNLQLRFVRPARPGSPLRMRARQVVLSPSVIELDGFVGDAALEPYFRFRASLTRTEEPRAGE